jgi:hypothetical protein
VARSGSRFLADYTFDEHTGLWHHRAGAVEPPLRLSDVSYDPTTGAMRYPRHDTAAPVEVLREHLADAVRLAAERSDPDWSQPSTMREDFESLRWFELPATSLP